MRISLHHTQTQHLHKIAPRDLHNLYLKLLLSFNCNSPLFLFRCCCFLLVSTLTHLTHIQQARLGFLLHLFYIFCCFFFFCYPINSFPLQSTHTFRTKYPQQLATRADDPATIARSLNQFATDMSCTGLSSEEVLPEMFHNFK